MFLIEHLPKEADKVSFDSEPADRKSILQYEITRNIQVQLNAAWTPQYCKKFGVRNFGNMTSIQASNNAFQPQNLIIPHVTQANVTNGKF